MPDSSNARAGVRTRALTPSSGATGPGCLVVLEGPARGRKYRIDRTTDPDVKPEPVVLGRSVEADIAIDDAEVSRAHAKIRRDDSGAIVLEDLGSRNGTHVNGLPIDVAQLSFGDKIRLGSNVMLVLTHYDPVEQQLLQRQRLETLGRLGAGIAHDLNNMQQVVSSTVAYMRDLPANTPLGDEVLLECLDDLSAACARSKELAGCLLGYARAGNEPHADVEVADVVNEVVKLSQRTFGLGIEITSEISKSLDVIGNSAELHQLVMNLCVNARDAMPDGGTLTVRAKLMRESELTDVELPSYAPYVLITVSDTGSGMDPVTSERAFEAFFTTKERGAGSGLGLAMVRDIVVSHGGKIELESEVGKGTTFRVYLPAATSGSRKPALTQPNAPETSRAPTTILLVEDEVLVRKSLSRVIRGAGFQVLTAAHREEAVRTYIEAENSPALVILDLEMPGMAGPETLAELRRHDADVHVLLVSGRPEDLLERAARAYGGAVGKLRKPFKSEQLIEAIEEALRTPSEVIEDTVQRRPKKG
jgi:two-component system cell cycle sensor histidine kinase/response regulator CckA